MVKGIIKVLDANFNFLGEIDEYSSLQWTRKLNKPGEFELHINVGTLGIDILQEENFVMLDGKEHKVGIIRHRELSQENIETLVIRGSMLSSIVSRRITIPPVGLAYDVISNYAESVIKHYVNANCINPVDIKRKIPNLILAVNKSRGPQIKWQSRLKQLDEELERISLNSELGWDISIDIENSMFVFDVIEGRNLTAEQELLPPVIFSIDFDNVRNQKYINSSINYKNIGYVGGQGEGEERSIVEVGEQSQGLNRFETFIDARDIENANDLPSRGLQKLKEYQDIKTFESDVVPYGSFDYEKDWDLGDIVTVQNKKWNLTMNSRITEVKEIYESSGFRLEVTFGNNIPNLIDKIKQTLDSPIVEKGTLQSGEPGVSINYTWDGTQLGVKREDEANYQYVNLQGPQGPKGDKGDVGPQGLTGAAGKNLEFVWSGTQLGVRQQGQSTYTYIDLKGAKGDTGPQGIQGIQGAKGDTGTQGIKGDKGTGFNPRGDWTSGAAYSNGKSVMEQSFMYNAKEEEFIFSSSTTFTLTKGRYALGVGAIEVYFDGQKQSSKIITEVSPTEFSIPSGIPTGTVVLARYLEETNYLSAGLMIDVVSYNGNSYYCKVSHTSSASITPVNTTYWGLLAEKGAKGDKGDTGATGPQGIQGIKGDKGDTGAQGLKGDTGAQGPQGPKGDQGLQGIQGPKGDTGLTGAQGPKGDTGTQGPQGIQGIQGPKGDKGDQGIQGVQGIKGDKGTGFNPKGAWVSGAAYSNGKSVTEQSFIYNAKEEEFIFSSSTTFTLTKGRYALSVGAIEVYFDGQKQSSKIITEVSPTEFSIPNGIPTGTVVLARYLEETNYLSAGLMIDVVSYNGNSYYCKVSHSSSASITPVNTTYWGLLAEKGAKGDKGDTGATGPQGIQGIKGDKGDTGAQGLKGDTGSQGPQGPKGDQGLQGIQGPKGDTGPQGPPGTTDYNNLLNKPNISDIGKKTLNGSVSSAAYFAFAQTPINPVEYSATFKITVTSPSSALIGHTLYVHVEGHANTAPTFHVSSNTNNTSAATTGLYYLRGVYPKTVNNGYRAYIEFYVYNTTQRDIKIELIESNNVDLLNALAASSYNSTYQSITTPSVYYNGFITNGNFNGSLSGNATSATNLYNGSFKAGEPLVPNDMIFLQNDEKWYKVNVAGRTIPIGTILARCNSTEATGDTVSSYIQGYFNLPGVVGTIEVYKDIFIRGTLVNGVFTTDGTITTVLSPNYTYMRVGSCINSASYINYDGNNRLYTLNATGEIDNIDGYKLSGSSSNGAIKITTSATEPSNPNANDFWYKVI